MTSGTREWSAVSYNCVSGCSHGCRYCYARHDAVVRFHRMEVEDWLNPTPRPRDLAKSKRRYEGVVMFPTSHDIVPEVLDICMEALDNMLTAGNTVLLVSKPHLLCIKKICSQFAGYATSKPNRSRLRFRFTIGCDDDDILSFWEPGAPSYKERMSCLKHAFRRGFSTSISVEPILDPPNTVRHVRKLLPYVTDTIWLGLMNRARQRVEVKVPEEKVVLDQLLAQYDSGILEEIRDKLADEARVVYKNDLQRRLASASDR